MSTSTTDPGSRSAAEIEQDVERSRARLSGTLDELRERLSPGQLFEQVMDYAKGSGGREFLGNLGSSVRDNPLPVLLIGAGIGWMMLGGGHDRPSRDRGWDEDEHDYAGGKLGQAGSSWVAQGRDAAASAGSAIGDLAGQARDTASEAASRVGEWASEASDAASGAAARVRSGLNSTASAAAGSARQARQGLGWLTQEQPLLLGAAGLALGALLGSILPSSEAEDRLLGETRDQALRAGGEALSAAGEEAKERLAEGLGDAKERLAGASGTLAQAASELGAAVGDAAHGLSEHAQVAIHDAADRAAEGTRPAERPMGQTER